ncbi:MAG: helicase [Hydrogenophilales bacterium 28-61-23]|nr:MAG: helicase [Hydrogenophilales bacterium 28-61-23]
MPRLPEFTLSDITRWFGEHEIEKAQAYLDAVSHLEVRPPRVTASVQGGGPFPYRVAIGLDLDKLGKPRAVAGCSCPVGWMCKHAAAVMLHLLNQGKAQPKVRPDVLEWLDNFRESLQTPEAKKPGKKPGKSGAAREALFYVLYSAWGNGQDWSVRFIKARRDEQGMATGTLTEWNNVERALIQPPRFVSEEDLVILRLLWSHRSKARYTVDFPLRGRAGEETLQYMLDSGRLLADQTSSAPLHAGQPRAAQLDWRYEQDGSMRPELKSEPAIDATLPLDDLWYLDTERCEIGPLQLDFPASQIARLLAMPALNPAEVPLVASALAELAPQLPAPAAAQLRIIDVAPTPILSMDTLDVLDVGRYRRYGYNERKFDYLLPAFQYDEVRVEAHGKQEYVATASGETVHIKRRLDDEKRWLKDLESHGIAHVPANTLYASRPRPPHLYGLESPAHWPEFMAEHLPALRDAGWQIQVAAAFRHLVLEAEDWDAELSEDAGGWFNLNMGVMVQGQRLPLAPLLHDLFHSDARWLDAAKVKAMPDQAAVILTTPSGSRLRVPAGRIKPLALTLIDLFDAQPSSGELRLSKLDAPRLAAMAATMADMQRWQFKGADAVTQMAKQLQHSDGIHPAEPPVGLALTLRPYQLEGLAWLQYLREHDLAGILADDMGLGKTAQTLAHLLLEKEAGRMDRPCLVILPTSLIFNWKREAERFAPSLRVLSLHGKERAERFDQIAEHDVVMTTYPLLWRDEEVLAAQEYHLLILDEAQTVKNAASHAAQVVRKLRARHRLCLTGTPLENHLGELWAQFDFLLPGFLADSKSFTKTWRTPIEKHGDSGRRDILAARVRPFILRRRKEDVAKELPEKTIIVRTVELEGSQRDLYETVRSAMDAKVREAIADKGFARSHIVILDALLKLRQVCCDPRLVKLESAQKVKERAKLDQLMDMLPELVDEGRRVLVFSQFTSMLALIEQELIKLGLGYVKLTGETQDREGVIGRFQDEGVPIFLISLKAGGVGLNLTAADTVIHYDPWWNPAVENQATDRAHRIGQKNKVFVYKLVVAGSIEEKILVLQEKKAELAAGVLSEDAAAMSKFGESDLRALLAPLPVAKEGGHG